MIELNELRRLKRRFQVKMRGIGQKIDEDFAWYMPSFISICLLSFLVLTSILDIANAQVEEPINVTIDRIGIAFVDITGTMLGSEMIKCIGEPLYIYNFSPADLIVYLDLETNSILLLSAVDEILSYKLIYVAYLSRLVGDNAWEIKTYLPYQALILLPEGSVVRYVEPPPLQVLKVGERIGLLMGLGNVSIGYVIGVTQPIPINTIAETTTPETTQPAEQKQRPYMWIYTIIIILLLVSAIYYVWARSLKQKKPGVTEEIEAYLDERDRSILNYLKEKGSATPTELLEATGMPKSAFYRRLARLEKIGLIEGVDLGVKKVYRIKKSE